MSLFMLRPNEFVLFAPLKFFKDIGVLQLYYLKPREFLICIVTDIFYLTVNVYEC